MKSYRTVLLILVGLILLTPTCVLVVRASDCGHFPTPELVDEVVITAPNGVTERLTADHPGYTLLFELFSASERVSRRSLPKKEDCAVYRLDFVDSRLTETLTLFVSKRDFSCWIRTSENRLYRFPTPTLSIGSVTLAPAKLEWKTNGTSVFLYPDARLEDLAVSGNQVLSWEKLVGITASTEPESTVYHLYRDGEYLDTVTDPADIREKNPENVLLISEWRIDDAVSIGVTFLFDVQP